MFVSVCVDDASRESEDEIDEGDDGDEGQEHGGHVEGELEPLAGWRRRR